MLSLNNIRHNIYYGILYFKSELLSHVVNTISLAPWERSGSVIECLTRDRGVLVWASPTSLRCGPWARHIYPSLVLVQPRKTRPCLTERLLMGCKESNQTNKQNLLGSIRSWIIIGCKCYSVDNAISQMGLDLWKTVFGGFENNKGKDQTDQRFCYSFFW